MNDKCWDVYVCVCKLKIIVKTKESMQPIQGLTVPTGSVQAALAPSTVDVTKFKTGPGVYAVTVVVAPLTTNFPNWTAELAFAEA